ncbi:GspH/FimT family pseudopilin [Rhodoferax sp.]|uniref:GspH/FimT family pseudopilin n=1 Tax=Rhodoferax sp. TaxID=50421 RepID=UPI0027461DCF|nr:GspH/FimT family pseudopilin [Rhodoferax sp.]
MKQRLPLASKPRPARGFTLIELLIVVAILGILAALAAPSFTETIKRYRVNAITDDLTSSIQLARSEAIRRRVQIGLDRTAGCGVALATVDDWDCGWNMFVDVDGTGTFTAGDTVFRSFTIPTGYHLTHNAAAPNSVMLITRFGQPGTPSERFLISPPEGVAGSATRAACFFPGGSLRTGKGTPPCAAL